MLWPDFDSYLQKESAGGRNLALETNTGTVITMGMLAAQETSCSPGGTSGTVGFSGTRVFVGVGNVDESGQMTLDGAGI